MVDKRKTGRYLAPALAAACAVATAAQAGELTIDRLFDAPALSGPTIIGLKVSPDGARVTYLKGKPESKDCLDLWEYNIRDAQSRMLVDSAMVTGAGEKLSDEEINRRERQRTIALSGILEYSFAPSGQALLFPLAGTLYYYDLAKPVPEALKQITHSPGPVTDATVSPNGTYIAYHSGPKPLQLRYSKGQRKAAHQRWAWPH